MLRKACMAAFAAVMAMTTAFGEPLQVEGEGFTAEFDRGTLVSLKNDAGRVFAAAGAQPKGTGIHRVGQDHWAGAGETVQPWGGNRAAAERYTAFPDLDGAHVDTHYTAADAGVVITQEAASPQPGVWGVEWAIEGIPLDLNILVPGRSGIKLTAETPGASHTFDYPHVWEAQFVVVEGEGCGFCVWAEDAEGRFKRLTVNRTEQGWRLGFITMPFAPFEEQSACTSVPWHLEVYEGDWRVPARRYRDWMAANLHPTPVGDQGPAWVKDIRCCVIMGMDTGILEALPTRLDPKQTILYVPSWRKAGYDRDYPSYDEPYEELAPFVERAHALGFRVMLHVNYFGCDPLNPLYAEFEPYQVRDPWGSHDKEWWLWERADPVIKFAYINPAHKPWRDVFVERMVKLCNDFGVDSLHLDQTLCIMNDYNGLIDGVSMIEGNVLLHKELREALPHVALSGEGLNEVTCRYEAFAQRHAWGLNHSEGTFNVRQLQTAHPIGSYVLRPYTTIYGYLGYAPPTSGQLYAAWGEAYRHWGVIPTLKPNLAELENPTGFSAQFFDEAAFWLDRRVDIDLESPWPADIAFPYRTASGERVVATQDRRLLWRNKGVSHTLFGLSRYKGAGSIPGWYAYNHEGLFGLDPACWYPVYDKPLDFKALHVESMPEGYTVESVSSGEGLACVRTRPSSANQLRLAALIGEARCGSRPFEGQGEGAARLEVKGELLGEDGAMFTSNGDALHAHPPYRNKGVGVAYARFALSLPQGARRFVSEVAMSIRAVGEDRTDGVTYGVTVRCGDDEAHAEVHTAASDRVPLELDLRPFAGKDVELELSVHPGPARHVSYDWARWYGPRIDCDSRVPGTMALGGVDASWRLALSGERVAPIQGDAEPLTVEAWFPGAVYLLRDEPEAVSLPLRLDERPFETTFVSDTGVVLDAPVHACAARAASTVGGVERKGLFAHPPDHGRTIVDFPMVLPEGKPVFRSFVGLRDKSTSTGVSFIVQANGVVLAREKVFPGDWQEIVCDLGPWAGKPVVLCLITDSDGDYVCDWAQWGGPEVVGSE